MRVEPGDTMEGYDIDVAFLGSCTNARLKDLREAAAFVEGREVDDDVRAMVVPPVASASATPPRPKG